MSAAPPRAGWPIRARIALVYAALAASMAMAIGAVVFWGARAALYDALDANLHRDLELVLTALDLAGEPRLRGFAHASDDPDDADPVFQLWRGPAAVLRHPPEAPWLRDLPAAEAGRAYFSVTAAGTRLRVHEARLSAIRPELVLQVVRDERDVQRSLAGLLARLALLLLAAVGAGIAAAYWAAGRALRPLTAIEESLRAVGPGRLQARVPVPPTGDEVAALAVSHNAMLDRVESGYRDAERFAGLIAHELRTPLASLRAGAEVALAGLAAGAPERLAETLRTTLEEADRLTQLVNRLLLFAQARPDAAREAVELHAVLVEAADLLQPLADEQGKHIEVAPGGPVHARADRVVVMQMVLDLMDNALRHAGPAVTLRLAAARTGAGAGITVADDGIGLGASRTHGTGLGTELVTRLAALLGGSVRWLPVAPHGTRVEIELPAADAH